MKHRSDSLAGARLKKPRRFLPTEIAIASLILAFLGWFVYTRGRNFGSFESGIGVMRALVSAESKFAHDHPDVGYTCALSALPREENRVELIQRRKNQYSFEISGCGAIADHGPATKYQILARPLIRGLAAFCADQSGILRYDEGGSIDKCLKVGVPIG